MLASNDPDIRRSSPLCVAFAGASAEPAAVTLRLDVPWLAGDRVEQIFPAATPAGSEQGVQLFRSGGVLVGHVREPFRPAALADQTESIYRRVIAVTRGRHLVRIWNYLPQINAHTAQLENYRAFCQGRSLAFESALGDSFHPWLPAASAVGSSGTDIDVIFAATETEPRHFENPEQIPAYNYPPEHGPRAPSFARATVARDGRYAWTFISGTSAVKGHQTVAPGSLSDQLDCTLDNLSLISRTIGLGDSLGAGKIGDRYFKIYLRHAADLAITQARLDQSLLRPSDRATYLQADICRAALNIEIEATLVEN